MVTELFNTGVNDFDAKKSTHCRRVGPSVVDRRSHTLYGAFSFCFDRVNS